MEEERAPGPRSNLWRLVTSNAASSKNVCSWWQRGTCSCGVPSQNKTQNCTCCIISTNQTQSMQTRLERSIPRVTTVFFFCSCVTTMFSFSMLLVGFSMSCGVYFLISRTIFILKMTPCLAPDLTFTVPRAAAGSPPTAGAGVHARAFSRRQESGLGLD